MKIERSTPNFKALGEVKFRIQKQLEELQVHKRNLDFACPDPKILARYLHDRGCFLNHTDGCGWYYEEGWYKGLCARKHGTCWDESTHKQWLDKAKRILSGTE